MFFSLVQKRTVFLILSEITTEIWITKQKRNDSGSCSQTVKMVNFDRLIFILGCEVWGVKQKKCIIDCWASRWLHLFYSPKPRSHVWILVYRNWTNFFSSEKRHPKNWIENRPFLWRRHFTTTATILQDFAFLCKLGLRAFVI